MLQPSAQPNHPHCVLNCITKTIPISQRLRLLKIANHILFSVFFFQNLLSQCGDIEKNPGFQYSSLSFYHWNLNGLTAHDCINPLWYKLILPIKIFCLSEAFLNSSIQSYDHKLKIDGYNLIRFDHPSDSKKGGVCIYYKQRIPLISRDELCTLDNCVVTEIRSQSEK